MRNISRAGGSLLAFSILAGLIAGIVIGEPSIGILIGAAAGIAIALLVWILDRSHGD